MTIDPAIALRMKFLMRVSRRECNHLLSTDQRLFREPFTEDTARKLESDADPAERVEAFAEKFCRLQDTIGDKLLPVLLTALGEAPAAAIDNPDKAERLGFVASADEWMARRKLGNQMAHEYIEDMALLASAPQSGYASVPIRVNAATAITAEIDRRGWA